MAHWTDSPTAAHRGVSGALKVVDNLLSFAKDTQGKPAVKERALFGSAVVFTYGIWENFVEQLAVELATHVADEVEPAKVPDQIRKSLEKKSAWELIVTPGWRALWIDIVRTQAVGSDEKFGMNTAKAGQVKQLLAVAGVEDPFKSIPLTIILPYLITAKAGTTATDAINALVALRGEIVHTGKIPDKLRKGQAHAWRNFVEGAADEIDKACRAECKKLLH